MVDARGFRLAQRIKQEHPELRRVPREQMRAAAKEEAFMLRFDQERALAALPHLLRTEEERREAVDIVRRIGYADGEITAESEALLDRIERILELDRPAHSKPAQRAARSSSSATAAE
jgi:tellurite resistance protein